MRKNSVGYTHPVLKSFVQIVPIDLQLLVKMDDITIGVYDTEKLLINIPAKKTFVT